MDDLNLMANIYLYNLQVGNGYNDVIVIKRTDKRIYLSNGIIIHINRYYKNRIYLDSKCIKYKNKHYPVINQVLRDIEGYLIYLYHS